MSRLGTSVVGHFASIEEWITSRPWQAIRAAMQEELVDVSWTELCFGSAFLATGSRRAGE
jgi:demethylmenaquinone methyltransferase/2-methoxy-6-polyprenyl-1,4-benzoquinol methylase